MQIDIAANRTAQKYRWSEQLQRICWGLCRPLFSLSPRPFYAWRRWLLRRFGAHIGKRVHVVNTARIYFPWHLHILDDSAIGDRAIIYNLGEIRIGCRTTISQGAHLCAGTHDYESADMKLLKPPIAIGSDVWVCADAFVGPGVVVGDGAVIGARAVVTSDIAAWTIVAGNPARFIKQRNLISGSQATV